MNIKKSSNNAGLTTELVRFGVGFVAMGLVWWALGWAISSRSLAIVFVIWGAIIGPLVVAPFLWISARFQGKLTKPDLSKDPDLCNLYFRSILRRPGPAPEIWLWDADFSGFLYFENLLSLGRLRSRQTLLLSRAWLDQPFEIKEKQWEQLWDGIAAQSWPRLMLRRVELHAWMGYFSLLELFAAVLRMFLEVLGMRDLPSGGFWLQFIATRIHNLWFGGQREFFMLPRKNHRGEKVLFPRALSSLLIGPWFAYNWTDFHPLYLLITPTIQASDSRHEIVAPNASQL